VRLAEIAAALGLALEGDGGLEIEGLGGLDDAGPRDLSFAAGARYRRAFERSRAGAYLLPPGFDAAGRACLRTPRPYADFARAIDLFAPPPPPAEIGVHATAVVAPDARLGRDVSVRAFAVIGAGASVGDRTVLHPHVTLYPGVSIGADCVIHSGAHLREGTRLGDRAVVQNGAVLGSDGFGHVVGADGRRVTLPHRCPVEAGDDVEIGANCAIDASHHGQGKDEAGVTRTRLGDGVKIDNLVQVGHGCAVGEGSTLCAQVGLGGSTTVGRNTLFAGQSASAGHVRIGDGALVGARAAVHDDLEGGAQVLGVPALDRRVWARFVASRARLPGLLRRVRAIERRLGIGSEEGSD
jgi:UDP-3-O-[3-hydroxymyristoyl] glucosamine N-acyltransferase